MTTIDQQDLDSVDLADPTVWDDGPPYGLFARMQREAPVHFSPQRNLPDEGGFWSITRFDDVRAVSRDHGHSLPNGAASFTWTTSASRWTCSGCS